MNEYDGQERPLKGRGRGRPGAGIPVDDLAGLVSLLSLHESDPRFRLSDAMFAARTFFGWNGWYTNAVWHQLQRRGLIIRSGIPTTRRGCFYWQRTPGTYPGTALFPA